MRLIFKDDGKGKYQSCEVSMEEDDDFYNYDIGIYSHDLSSLIGYGETKEEAFEDFKMKFSYLMKELQAIENMLFCTDVYEIK